MITTRQQDIVLIALTRDYPRTAATIAAETGIPMASVRRTLSELKRRKDRAGFFTRRRHNAALATVLSFRRVA